MVGEPVEPRSASERGRVQPFLNWGKTKKEKTFASFSHKRRRELLIKKTGVWLKNKLKHKPTRLPKPYRLKKTIVTSAVLQFG